MSVCRNNKIAIQTPTAPTLKDHITVFVNMDIKEMVIIVKVCIKYFASLILLLAINSVLFYRW